MAWQFWIDRGGTFTDIVGRAPDGRLATLKLLSDDPDRYPDAALAGIRALLGLAPAAPIPAGLVDSVKMGTTVGTNALLTRTGEPTLLVVTAGFKDQLLIGDQTRPDIFALRIERPAPLHAEVIEAAERLDANGEVIRDLDETALSAALIEARRRGLNACAIAFMHAWKNPEHELRAGELARRAGFGQVSLSHRVSPLIKFVPRAETAVLDAYLSPPLRRYVDRVAAALPADCSLEFMQSNGGLVAADRFHGKDSVLSGPAGGLIGMVKVGRAAGFCPDGPTHHPHPSPPLEGEGAHPPPFKGGEGGGMGFIMPTKPSGLIGFDMGGTSTDVSLHAGELERREETRVAGCRVRVPMLAVHTVAAGGGSLLHFDGGRLQVGPDSAGSQPGPAAYRRGGPLTVTDANLLLGRVQAAHFPAIFGPHGDQPLDVDRVTAAFARLAGEVNATLGLAYTPERLADAFLAIAVENMADAVRHITLERGIDPAGFSLVAFGGAGGQLACRVAERLGIGQVLLSPFASVLSAYGIGLAERRELRRIAVERPLDETIPPNGSATVPAGGNDASSSIRALLRYAGAETTLDVPLADTAAMATAFHAKHAARFGFSDPARAIVCAAWEIETVSGGVDIRVNVNKPAGETVAAAKTGTVPVYLDDAWRDLPLFQRADLGPAFTADGPVLIVEPGSCIVVDPGWTARLTPTGDLVLTSAAPRHARPDPDRPDPAWLTLFNRRFMSIAEDMGRVLQLSARSVNIRERLDFSCALFDRRGDLIANAPHIPVHLGSMGDSVKAILASFTDNMRPGDAFLINSPYHGGTHLPDITVVRPVFSPDGGALRYFTAARAHHADVGGIAPGSMPAASTRIEEEGCLSEGMRVVAAGRFLKAEVLNWLNTSAPPARNPEQNLADLHAQLAACALGERLLRQLEDEVGSAAVLAYMGFVQDYAEAAVVRLLDRLKDGRFTLPLDTGGPIDVAVRIAGGRATLDFTGSGGPHPGNLNAPAAIVRSAVLYVFRCLLDVDIPLNAGVSRPLDILLAPGSLLDPRPPAAVVAGNVETSQNIVDALFGALGVLAASQGTMNNLSFGDGTHQYYETVCGGAGAGEDFDGASGVHTHMTNSRLTDPEVLELNYPVRVERFGLRAGSGGAGRHAGGDGVVRRLRFLAPMQANLIALRRHVAPFGLAGGEAGKPGRQWIERADGSVEALPGITPFRLDAGDAFVLETPGGGGFGPAGEA